ncbi:MAG: UvrD-helicase domain-containing protein, partial [Candidatus Yanofskybacteria bacterium]|nr:UvrD-helicase domain-containing protein [Candidatus Yanofskybacteria bacterium]
MDKIFQGLNEKQQEAVRTIKGPVLVISGPGSGKTRCLTHRIAHLIASGIEPENILGVTFTNKAAGEIKERVTKLLGDRRASQPTLATFHSLGVR